MDVITVASMLIIAGYTDVYTVDESALDIVEACGIGPVSVPATGFKWGVRVLRWKKQRTRLMLTAFRYYNGSGDMIFCRGKVRKRQFCYAGTAYSLYRRLL